jgi:hypothetical protein
VTDRDSVDHLVLAAPDMDGAVHEITRRFGVHPSPGGRHTAWGTRNALLSLGPRVYLEIVGPDPGLAPPPGPRPFRIGEITAPTLVTWCSRGRDLQGIAAAAARLGVSLGEVQQRSRTRPDGVLLSWHMTDPFQPREGGVVPFFIDWGSTPHPAESAAAGAVLAELRLCHPEPERICAVLKGLGVEMEVVRADSPALTAVFVTPRGVQIL